MGACRGPFFLIRSQKERSLKSLRRMIPLGGPRRRSLYRPATLFFLLAGAAAAFFGAGHAAW